jgi:[NiFe] hydrogenase assembly HybE family chaperone
MVQAFEHIASTRMLGVPVQNPALRVQATGFESGEDLDGKLLVLTGILITPWFMNLVRLPDVPVASGLTVLAIGRKARRNVGSERFEFIGAMEDGLAAFEVCSLFSPMFEFASQDAALATANEVLALLRKPPGVVQASPAVPSRRGFLLGRSASGAGA